MGKEGQTPTASNDPNDGHVLISAAGNVDLESVQATSDNKSSSKSGSASIGYSWNLGAQPSAGFAANGGYASDKSNGSSVTQINSNVSGTNTVTVVSGDTLKLAGAVLSGNAVNAAAKNGIVIESRQDTAAYNENNKSASLSIGPSPKGSVIGGGYNQGSITGNYANVTQQSGIFAGSGGYHVRTDGTIDLIGGFIGSTADPTSNDLTANQILYSNIANSMSASSNSYGISLVGPGIPVPVVGRPAKQSDHGETLATITPGNLNLANQQQDLSGLNTDASKANTQVDPFDIDKLKAQQQSAAALSQLMNMAIGYLGQKFQLPDGGTEKVALHAAAGALTALVAGGNVSTGALAGAGQELIGAIVDKALADNPDLTQDERNALGQWASVLVGMAAGGTQGAATALDAEKYNRQLHIDEGNLIKSNAARFAYDQNLCPGASDPSGCSQDEVNAAIGRLTLQALKQLDATAADLQLDRKAAEFLDSISPRDSLCASGGPNCSYFHAYGSEYRDATINSQYFQDVVSLYNLATSAFISKYNSYSRDFAAALDLSAQTAISNAAVDHNNAVWEAFNNLLAVGAGTLALSTRTTSGVTPGRLEIGTGDFSASERSAAQYMANLGYNVVLRSPVGTRADGGTSDLLVNGIPYDVYTPETSNLNRIVSAIVKKNSQTAGVIVDLRESSVSPSQLSNVFQRVRGAGATNIVNIEIIGK